MTREQLILSFNPFEGDRDCNCKTLRDAMVNARASNICTICREGINPGDRIRAKTEVSYDDRKVMTFRFCPKCCSAMADSWSDEGRSISDRTSIGMKHLW